MSHYGGRIKTSRDMCQPSDAPQDERMDTQSPVSHLPRGASSTMTQQSQSDTQSISTSGVYTGSPHHQMASDSLSFTPITSANPPSGGAPHTPDQSTGSQVGSLDLPMGVRSFPSNQSSRSRRTVAERLSMESSSNISAEIEEPQVEHQMDLASNVSAEMAEDPQMAIAKGTEQSDSLSEDGAAAPMPQSQQQATSHEVLAPAGQALGIYASVPDMLMSHDSEAASRMMDSVPGLNTRTTDSGVSQMHSSPLSQGLTSGVNLSSMLSEPPSGSQPEGGDVSREVQELQKLPVESNRNESADSPEGLRIRGYQAEISRKSKAGENDIIILPTGTGKTYVAIDIINNHLGSQPDPKIVFMAPAVELVKQQYDKICQYVLPQYKDKVRKIVGSDDQSTDQLEFEFSHGEFKIFVATPQIIENYVQAEDGDITTFTLVIFDEFHHSKKEHPYNRLLERYMEWKSSGESEGHSVQLVGLTASVGVGDSNTKKKAKKFVLEMCAKMNLSSPPSEVLDQANLKELQIATNKPQEIVKCLRRDTTDQFSKHIEEKLMVPMERQLRLKIDELARTGQPELIRLNTRMRSISNDKTCQAYDAWCIGMKGECIKGLDHTHIKLEMSYLIDGFEHLKILGRALSTVQDLRCEDGYKYLEQYVSTTGQPGEVSRFRSNCQDSMSALRQLAAQEKHQTNPKLLKLQELLNGEYTRNPKSRILIFVQRRWMTRYICDWIEKEVNKMTPGRWRPQPFTSTGPSVEAGGMAKNESAGIMDDMKTGKINILVTTSVAEEGIDIPECNATIRYMYIKDVISKIQARGRTRARGGKVYSIVDDSLASQNHKNNFKESLMADALKAIRNMNLKEFKAEVEEIHEISRLEAMHARRMKPKPQKQPSPNSPDLLCAGCGQCLGNLAKVRCYVSAQYLAWDETLHERCEVGPKTQGTVFYEGVQEYGKLICRNDKKVVGKVVTIKEMKFGVWKIEALRVMGAQKNYTKWKNLRKDFSVQDVDERRLLSEGYEKQLQIAL